MSFGGILSLPQTEFVFPDPVNATAASTHFLSRLYASNQLLNPVIGLRLDPDNPKITIGALDENDYQGNLNWVPIFTPNASWQFRNIITLDGLKGYNGSFLPNSSATYATVDSVFVGVDVPDVTTYLTNTGYAGPINYVVEDNGIVAYVCNSSEYTPYVALTATINGVDYPIDSTGNLLRTLSPFTTWGTCSVGLSDWDSTEPNINLGLPFLRSVYLAYRFPTDSCPGLLRLCISVRKYQPHLITNRTDAYIDTNAEFSMPCVLYSHGNTFADIRDSPTNANVNPEVSGMGRADNGELIRRARFGT
ncbi:hypothetical protein JVT61DRAFT_10955 [Boletus reticuloceps]|uniref:Peptidase A1 domain-containing protein n=1 Tax=Boletus reticuloceps TaxID=495285 RepID=A0A8I2YFQ0_9AGAM|nr:hypothetical protein JVT61DRAFT_10955 [Boletus reticuloceps]